MFPNDWYWIVNKSATHVYSSAVGDFVGVENAAYRAWLAAGNLPTYIASDTELGEVLAEHSLRPSAANVLDGYKDTHARHLTIKVVAKILLWLVNEVRTLKGQQTVNASQFRAFLKDQM